METTFVTESREMLFTGTEDIDVRPLHSSELHYEGDSREEALRAAHKVSAASRVGVCSSVTQARNSLRVSDTKSSAV